MELEHLDNHLVNEVVSFWRDASTEAYDMLLSGKGCGYMDGYEATRSIRALESPALADIPTLAMTANAFGEDRKAAMDTGMNGFLSKPIQMEALIQALHRVFGNSGMEEEADIQDA